jgi:hypothetical protein
MTTRVATGFLSIFTCVTISGCGTTLFSNRIDNPVLQDFVIKFWGRASTLSTTASRRLAIMVYAQDKAGVERLLTCAEPPPDVGETFAKAIAAQIDAKATSKTAAVDSASIDASYASTVATAIAPLMVRSQGLQVLRDSAYTLCIDHMNGWITDEEYIRTKDMRFEKAIGLIKDELPYLPRSSPSLAAPKVAASAPARAASAPAAATSTTPTSDSAKQ